METRFVMAHEVLHVALRHGTGSSGRDPYLWNVACDYVINDWLIEMQVGSAPALGLLHDPQLKGLSAEEVYDRIVVDMRRMRKLLTLARRGRATCWSGGCRREQSDCTDLDDFYRTQLGKGLLLHESQGRGLLPAGLLEEIRALLQPPIPWDVELARWFDHHFPPLEQRRTYARLSRRQSATPDIPRPRSMPRPEVARRPHLRRGAGHLRLDGPASCSPRRWARSPATRRRKDVPAVRVVFCDASAYDRATCRPRTSPGACASKGAAARCCSRRSTCCRRPTDFPKNGPILIITDGQCDRLNCQRAHAFLLPAGRRLPFATRAEVFYMR